MQPKTTKGPKIPAGIGEFIPKKKWNTFTKKNAPIDIKIGESGTISSKYYFF